MEYVSESETLDMDLLPKGLGGVKRLALLILIAESDDALDVDMLGYAQHLLELLFGRDVICAETVANLNPARAESQSGCLELHIGSGYRTVLNPHIAEGGIGSHDNGHSAFRHRASPHSAHFAHALKHLFVVNYDKMPRMGIFRGRSQETGFENQFDIFGRKLLVSVASDAPAIEYKVVKIQFFHGEVKLKEHKQVCAMGGEDMS